MCCIWSMLHTLQRHRDQKGRGQIRQSILGYQPDPSVHTWISVHYSVSTACGHPLQDLNHLLLDCPASEPLRKSIFGSSLSMVQTLGCGPTVGFPRSSSAPPSLGRGRVVPPPPPHLWYPCGSPWWFYVVFDLCFVISVFCDNCTYLLHLLVSVQHDFIGYCVHNL